jgi:hypothetical protein
MAALTLLGPSSRHRFGREDADDFGASDDIFNIFVALALGFVFGRIYEIRRNELERRDSVSRDLSRP